MVPGMAVMGLDLERKVLPLKNTSISHINSYVSPAFVRVTAAPQSPGARSRDPTYLKDSLPGLVGRRRSYTFSVVFM